MLRVIYQSGVVRAGTEDKALNIYEDGTGDVLRWAEGGVVQRDLRLETVRGIVANNNLTRLLTDEGRLRLGL